MSPRFGKDKRDTEVYIANVASTQIWYLYYIIVTYDAYIDGYETNTKLQCDITLYYKQVLLECYDYQVFFLHSQVKKCV